MKRPFLGLAPVLLAIHSLLLAGCPDPLCKREVCERRAKELADQCLDTCKGGPASCGEACMTQFKANRAACADHQCLACEHCVKLPAKEGDVGQYTCIRNPVSPPCPQCKSPPGADTCSLCTPGGDAPLGNGFPCPCGTCQHGVCTSDEPGKTCCSNAKVDTKSDVNNCGSCGRQCGAAEACFDGRCVKGCAPTETACNLGFTGSEQFGNVRCCDARQFCDNGQRCVAKCFRDAECGSLNRCDLGTGRCIPR